MQYRRLGNNGPEISEIGFGCGGTAGLMTGGDFTAQLRAVSRALELGITYFDTAASYGAGQSESNLGRALAEIGANAVVATKVTLEWDHLGDIAKAVEESVQASLKRLRREQIDVVHLHNRVGSHRARRSEYGSGALLTREDVLGADGVYETLSRLRDAGAIARIGCCAFGGEPAVVQSLIDSGSFGSVLVNYSMLNTSAWTAATPRSTPDYTMSAARAAARGMGIVALRILEGGVLTGSSSNRPGIGSLIQTEFHDLVEPAIRFVLSNPRVSTALVGFSNLDQVDAAVAYAAKGPLSETALARINGISMDSGKTP